MKMIIRKHRAYIGILVAIFLVFFVAGKYSRSQSALSSNYVYATTVKDSETGEEFQYEVQLVNDREVKVTKTNLETGERVYQEVYPATVTAKEVVFGIPKDKGTVRLTKENDKSGTDTRLLIEAPSVHQPIERAVTQTTQLAQETSQAETSLTAQMSTELVSSSEKETTSSSKEMITAMVTEETSQTSKVTSSSTTVSDAKAKEKELVIDEFTDWLKGSQYAKGAILVQGRPLHTQTSFVASLLEADLNGQKAVIGLVGQTTGKLKDEKLLKTLREAKLTLFGNDLSSDDASAYQSNASFRIYQLKDEATKETFYSSLEEEYKGLNLRTDLERPAGYLDFYDKRVDHSKSYHVVIGSDQRVYWVEDYSGPADKSGFTLAPADMQEALKKILDQKGSSEPVTTEKQTTTTVMTTTTSTTTRTETSTSQATTLSSSSSDLDLEAILTGDDTSILGTYEPGNGGDAWIVEQGVITYAKDDGDFSFNIISRDWQDGMVVLKSDSVATFYVIPAGVSHPTSGSLGGDVNRDRIYVYGEGVNYFYLD